MATPAPLIGLIGKKRTGKDTFADKLVRDHGYTRVALADPLRDAALALDPIVGTFPLNSEGIVRVREWRLSQVIDELGWEKAKDFVPEVRRTLQRLGTESIRSLDDQFWIRTAFARIDALRADGKPVVVTDVSGITSLIEDGVNGLLIADTSADLIAAALMRLVRDGGLRRRLIQGGYSTARSHTLEHQASDMMSAVAGELGVPIAARGAA